jgi:hypothetical protein
MVFKCMTYLYRKLLSSGTTDKPADTHTHTVQQYKQHNDCLCGKEYSVQWRLLTSPCRSCFLVCLSVTFKFLNSVTDCYKSGVSILMKLEALGHLTFQFQRLSNNNKEYMQTFEVWTTLLTVHILCATGSWKNVTIYWVYIVKGCEIARWRHCINLVEFSVTMEMDGGK